MVGFFTSKSADPVCESPFPDFPLIQAPNAGERPREPPFSGFPAPLLRILSVKRFGHGEAIGKRMGTTPIIAPKTWKYAESQGGGSTVGPNVCFRGGGRERSEIQIGDWRLAAPSWTP